MEMEKINDNTIRVLLETDDLTERGITVLDLLGNRKEIESFFYSILDEVDIDNEFRENDAVTFQLLPNRNGLELFISKVNPKDIEDYEYDDDQDNPDDSKDDDEDEKDSKDDDKKSRKFSDDVRFTFLEPDGSEGRDITEMIHDELIKNKDKDSGQKYLGNDGDGVSEYLNDKSIERKHYVIEFSDFEDFVSLAKLLKSESLASSLYLLDNKYYLDLIFFVDQTGDSHIKDILSLAVEYGKRVSLSHDILEERGKCILSSSAFELARYYFK
ncbi:adaptor protein MecA [Liquorilactobacillus mali]|uniref:Adapter protein MecA n=1 Tax=Liquorilactobacillus mali KCTC 3596 = DSM 20444 TaxID=1046596 RepID=J0L765_9LACO|nr:adaptor protein MecA [Liquorilactobacillus mali]EJF00925.1 adaptor protein [Liquorilactobacillus mali KCTC 3596 = DSM 20444]KRN11504.1 adaptor protein [Liquorilactobacillus mali KCTC 3596 = DSM 20444]MDC7952397.1 adaptor protein MecA [Liquorilactobacillus mali]MDV7756748.1 adaptor protein MecA [Liquorilactobacillus mali]QFQ74253.1 adaptor protein MecA [Liquorilactobacillus mali]